MCEHPCDGGGVRPLHEDFYFMYKCLDPNATDFKALAASIGARDGQLFGQKGDNPPDLKKITVFIGETRVLIKVWMSLSVHSLSALLGMGDRMRQHAS